MKTEWIWVDLLPDETDETHNVFPRWSKERMNEIEAWLQEQFIAGVIDKWLVISNNRVGLSREEDAMAVKLRWG